MPGSTVNASPIVLKHAITADNEPALNGKILECIPSSARFVLIGEASHGTKDFYRQRANLTKMLITQKGFNAVVVEADFPDAFRANMFARGLSEDNTVKEALAGFKSRFPLWMWRNTEVSSFINWLKKYNSQWKDQQEQKTKGVGFYGMDIYSLHRSATSVLEYLHEHDPDSAERVAARYRCFDRYGEGSKSYAAAVALRGAPSCADQAVAAAVDVVKKEAALASKSPGIKGEELAFATSCNVRVVRDAESYYRNMFFGDELTWTVRDTHMVDTVKEIEKHLQRVHHIESPRLVVWAHNSHLGDSEHTDMGKRRGEVNVGHLTRQAYGMGQVFNIGFTTHTGTVAASDKWNAPCKHKKVKPSMEGSYERVMHDTGLKHFAVDLRHAANELKEALEGPRLERAIGVIYRPDTERQSHYFKAWLPQQFDLVIHVDSSLAVVPLDPIAGWPLLEPEEDLPESYPFGV